MWVDLADRLVVLLVYMPLVLVADLVTGGPGGSRAEVFWIVTLLFGVVAILISMRLPPPWNGRSRDEPSAAEMREYRQAAERQLSERGGQLSQERANDVRLLIDSGFEHEALQILEAETSAD